MMDGVIFPEGATMKHAVQPIQHEIRRDQEQHGLRPEWKPRQWTMTIVVKRDQAVGVMNVEDHPGADHQKPDPQDPRKHPNEEPVTDVADAIALAPPPGATVARPAIGQ